MRDRDRIEIVELGLDEAFVKEIEGEMQLSDEIKIKIRGHLEGLKQQTVNKQNLIRNKWEGKLDIIFGLLKESYDKDPKTGVPKTAVIEAMSCTEREFSPLMQKFKNYLRTTKEDKWTLSKRKAGGSTTYSLIPFG